MTGEPTSLSGCYCPDFPRRTRYLDWSRSMTVNSNSWSGQRVRRWKEPVQVSLADRQRLSRLQGRIYLLSKQLSKTWGTSRPTTGIGHILCNPSKPSWAQRCSMGSFQGIERRKLDHRTCPRTTTARWRRFDKRYTPYTSFITLQSVADQGAGTVSEYT